MKEYRPNDFRDFALSELERTIKENPNRIKISSRRVVALRQWYVVDSVIIYERVPPPHEQERIYIAPFGEVLIAYRNQNGKTVSLEKVLAELKAHSSKLYIRLQPKILKKLDRKRALVKLFDKFFLIKSFDRIYSREDSYCWFHTSECNFFEVSRKEALLILA